MFIRSCAVTLYVSYPRSSVLSTLTSDTPPTISVGLDGWSAHHHSYLGMNSHYLNKDWERVIFNIACIPFDESHTGENIYKKMVSVLQDWDILHMIGPCLRDNAANMKAAFKLPECSLRSLGCINHTLQLSINDEIFKLPSVETLIKKCKTLAGHANSSTTFYNEFYKEQRLRGITDRQSLKQDVDTR